MIYKRCGRCGKRLEEGTKCECQKKRHQEYDRYSRNQKSKNFYSSSEWNRTRERVLEMDERIDIYVYMNTGEIILADTVHHITPLRDDWNRRIDTDNLMSLHHDTHSMIESKYKVDKDRIMNELYQTLKRFRAERRAGAI